MMLFLWIGAAWAQENEPCVCPEEDSASVFARSAEVFIARSGRTMPSELTPIIALKGDLPRRAYISDTWEACDLEAGPRNSLMLVTVDEVGHMSRCGGAGPFPIPGSKDAMSAQALREWLRHGGWLGELMSEELLLQVVEREMTSNPVEYPEQGVAIEGFPDINTRLDSGIPIMSLQARVPGPRWMTLTTVAGPDGAYYVSWQHEKTINNERNVWESHSLWRHTPDGPVVLWHVESPQTPVLNADPSERIGIEVLSGKPMVAAFDDASAVAVMPGTSLFSLELDAGRGWQAPQILDAGANVEVFSFDAGDQSAVVAWEEGGALLARRFLPASGWSEPSSIAASSVSALQVVVNDAGMALMVWKVPDGQIWTARMSSSGEWEPATAVAGQNSSNPHIDLSSNGRSIIVWVEDGAIRTRQMDRRGNSWSRQRALSYQRTAEHPRAAIDRWGRAVVVWAEGAGLAREVYARTHRPLRGWEDDPERLVTNRRGRVGLPEVIIADGGGASVFWLQEGSRAMLWGRDYTSRRGWSNAKQVLLLEGVQDDQRPASVLHADGTVTLAWVGEQSGWTSRYIIGGAGFERQNAFEEHSSEVLSLSMDAYGEHGIMLIWSQGDEMPVEIWFREHSSP